jgi:hypothetical protein
VQHKPVMLQRQIKSSNSKETLSCTSKPNRVGKAMFQFDWYSVVTSKGILAVAVDICMHANGIHC